MVLPRILPWKHHSNSIRLTQTVLSIFFLEYLLISIICIQFVVVFVSIFNIQGKNKNIFAKYIHPFCLYTRSFIQNRASWYLHINNCLDHKQHIQTKEKKSFFISTIGVLWWLCYHLIQKYLFSNRILISVCASCCLLRCLLVYSDIFLFFR